jgi:hypothetical protein
MKENTKEETNLKKTERVNEIEEIHIIIDSHGNGISAQKMYRNKKAKVTVLPRGEKTIAGAQKYCKYHILVPPKHLVIGVGSNDLDKKPTNTCISEMKNLLSDLVANHIGTTVHVLPAFERVHNDTL